MINKHPRTLWMIRHAESEGNAGLPSTSAATIPLSSYGRTQAAALAKVIGPTPDLIATSKYQRTFETATPTFDRFPSVRHEVWDTLHEFTYLRSELYAGKTQRDRVPAMREYWERCDPSYNDGPNSESFSDFMARVDAVWRQLHSRSEAFTICFSHGFTIKALVWRILFPDLEITAQSMAAFYDFHRCHAAPNAQILPFILHDGTTHPCELPKSIQTQILQ